MKNQVVKIKEYMDIKKKNKFHKKGAQLKEWLQLYKIEPKE